MAVLPEAFNISPLLKAYYKQGHTKQEFVEFGLSIFQKMPGLQKSMKKRKYFEGIWDVYEQRLIVQKE